LPKWDRSLRCKRRLNTGMNYHGWRKPTPGLGVAEQHAQAGERMMLLDTLGAFTKPQDWEEGNRPIVWASNAYLMEQTGFSLSALKRHARRLVDFGVVSFKDSPNGKRWGHRDDEGHIVEAYGFDLAPLAARAVEFEALFEDLKAERQLCQRLKRQITITRRALRARIERALEDGLSGPWGDLRAVFDTLIERLPKSHTNSEALLSLLSLFRGLQERVHSVLSENESSVNVVVVDNVAETTSSVQKSIQKMNPKGAINDPHILITKQLNPGTHCTELPDRSGPWWVSQNTPGA